MLAIVLPHSRLPLAASALTLRLVPRVLRRAVRDAFGSIELALRPAELPSKDPAARLVLASAIRETVDKVVEHQNARRRVRSRDVADRWQ
jgi:hypothetical protein